MKIITGILLTLFFSVSSWALSSNSIYNAKGKWTNQDGKQVEFSSLQGKVRIISMIFTRCPSACPLIVGDIKQIRSKLPASVNDKIAVDLFSFDPDHDNPEALRVFMKKFKIENSSWTTYTSNKNTVSEVAALLGVQYKQLEGGAFVHSNNIILVNKEGEIIKTIEGYDASADEFISLVKKTVGE